MSENVPPRLPHPAVRENEFFVTYVNSQSLTMKREALAFSAAARLVCSKCHTPYSLSTINTYAPCCNQPLLVQYDYSNRFSRDELQNRSNTMWRYFEMLPVKDEKNIVSLGEGMTRIVKLSNLASRFGFSSLLLKDESSNPTGSFKARGLSVAISKAKELGIDRCIIPTAGNAGGAMAAYCAKAGMESTVVMPDHTPEIYKKECKRYGAELILVKGLINDCAKKVEELKAHHDYFDVSTLKEPYRLEGKKTMGYEIAEQLHWQLPDVIICPVGGGTGLIGIWKAFSEMLELGWIGKPLPKMIAVQVANCAPLVASAEDPENWKQTFSPRPSIAYGLVVPYPFGIDLIRKVIDESSGEVVAVKEKEIIDGIQEVELAEGVLLSPEGSAAWKAVTHLLNKKMITVNDKILLLNTGRSDKTLEK
jgi:threonine synthase